MGYKTAEDYEKEIQGLKSKEKSLSNRIDEITVKDVPQKEKELIEQRQKVKDKKEEIAKVTETQRSELRTLEKGYRDLLQQKARLEYEKTKLRKEIKSLPTKIGYRQKQIEHLQKYFNPSRRNQKRIKE